MMHLKLLITFVLIQCFSVLCSTDVSVSWLKIQINHSLNCANRKKFCYRGNIAIKNFISGYFVMKQKNLTSEDLRQLKNLADEDGFYTVKTKVTTINGSSTFLSSMRARDFLDNGLRDRISIWLQLNGHPMAITFGTINLETPPPLIKLDNNDYKIVSIVSFRTSELAPEPDIEPYKQNLKKKLEEQKNEEELSFIEKYWLYFAVFICFCFASGTAPEEE